MRQADDYMKEVKALADLLSGQPEDVFQLETLFKSWTVNDVIGHLHMFDLAALAALESDAAFDAFFAPIQTNLNQGLTLLQCQYPFLGSLSGIGLFQKWQDTAQVVSAAYRSANPKQRVKWAGPEMSALSCITARQMDTWAHGQAVFDVLGRPRQAHDRIRNICHLGAVTFAWTFQNRGLPVPDEAPYVCLTAPSGAVWTWNSPSKSQYVKGKAVAFAQVVTQVRNIEDTDLQLVGANAISWMELAQCFAGKPETPPAKNTRYMRRL